MKIKTLIKELQKLDRNKEIKLYPKYISEEDTYVKHTFKKRYINDMYDKKWGEYIGIVF